MVMLQVIMAGLISILLFAIGLPILLSVMIGIVIWSLILFKTSVFDWFFINVEPNWSVILGNQTKYDILQQKPISKGGKDPRVGMFKLKSLREVGSGIRGKYPWEVKFESVDLRGEIVIGNSESGSPLKCYTSDNIELNITWQVILTPLRGCLTNLVRKGEVATQAYFKGKFEQEIISWVKKNTEDKIFSSIDNLKKEFIKVFGGPDTISDKEEEYGVFTNTPQIINVNRSSGYQKAAEGVQVAIRMGDVIDRMKAALDQADHNMILAAAAATVGTEINGMLLIPGLKDAQVAGHLMSAAGNAGLKNSGNTGNVGNKGKGKQP
jgi:hypothetical protein